MLSAMECAMNIHLNRGVNPRSQPEEELCLYP